MSILAKALTSFWKRRCPAVSTLAAFRHGAAGYGIHLVYVRLSSVEVSIARVAHRVRMGGHDVPEADLRRRFDRSLANLEVYKLLVDHWEVWESGEGTTSLVDRSSS